jgi:hypothetical protein
MNSNLHFTLPHYGLKSTPGYGLPGYGMHAVPGYGLPGYGMHGLGATQAQTAAVSIGTTLAQGASAAAITSATMPIGGAMGTFLGMAPALAVPVVGAAIAAVGVAIMAILNSGCGQTCIETSQWANQAEPLLQQNIDSYFAIPAPRPQSVQAAAVNNFMQIWNRLVALCTQPGLGNAGKNCIADRQSGACKWHATATGAYPGQPAQGQCWNWWNGYHDPIANDTQTYNDALGAQSPLAAAPSQAAAGVPLQTSGMTLGIPTNNMLLIAGAAVAAILLVTQL